MHRDKPPGIWDISDRSLGHVIGLGFVIGLVLSVIVAVVYLIVTEQHATLSAPW